MFMNIEKEVMQTYWNKYFILLEEFKERLLLELGDKYNEKLFQRIVEKSIIVIVQQRNRGTLIENEKKYVSIEDFAICKRLFELNYDIPKQELDEYTYDGSFWVERIKITSDTYLLYEMGDSNKSIPVYVRNIICYLWTEGGEKCELTQFSLIGTTILTTNKSICKYIDNAMYRKFKLDNIKSSIFSNSSAYMGSKKRIIGFIVESILPHCNGKSVFLDIMCGSGAVSNAMAQMDTVYASDAQDFCKLLAKIQGKGFSGKDATFLLKEMYTNYMYNLELLQEEVGEQLKEEERIFHLDLGDKNHVLELYKGFMDSYELYSSTEVNSKVLTEKINERKQNVSKPPYCLFTYYYANVYFGVAQCIQLDSIRYAIDQIADKEIREWALGTLVIVTSSIATSHAGHFAQPKKIDINSIEYIIKQRAKSAWLEFSKRLIMIAQESERYPNPVRIVEGPWKNALRNIRMMEDTKNLVVYLDAPYKREEYSRYYHVLETIVKYDYPSSEKKGRLRSKEKGERFSSEFFTKTVSKVEGYFVEIISSILSIGGMCAWSYSDNGVVAIQNVISQVREKNRCSVYLYSIPYKHLSQRKRKDDKSSKLDVTEYCIIFKS